MRTRTGATRPWLLLPGGAVLLFALASIALPVGSDGLGASLDDRADAATALAHWARDIHDGYWQGQGTPRALADRREARPLTDRSLAQALCDRGQARDAVALYRRIGVRTEADRAALFHLNEVLIANADYDLAEWYAPQGDQLVGGGTLRNNLAWHYTQAEIRHVTSLRLALSAVTSDRNACSVDTLAWAYWRVGRHADAVRTAQETLKFTALDGGVLDVDWEVNEAKASSRRLLDRIAKER